jgi:hypothetical protein
MSSGLGSLRSKSAIRWATEEPLAAVEEPVEEGVPDIDRLPREPLPLGQRVSRALSRFLITFCIGVAATLAWQSHGDAVREMIVSSYPQLGWLAPQALPDASTPDPQQLRAISTDLPAVRQSVDQFAAQFIDGQEQMARDITKLHATEQDILENIVKLHATEQDILASILDKIGSALPPRSTAAPARKPVPLTPAPLTPPVPPGR